MEKSKKLNILIVEDNDVNAEVSKLMLEKHGHHVTMAENGAKGVIATREQSFDIILMDCQMPVMDGFEATKIIRNDGKDLPIIAVTANVLDEDKKKCINAGMNDFLSKPVKSSDLISTIEKWAFNQNIGLNYNQAVSNDSLTSTAAIEQLKDIAGDRIGAIMENYFKSALKLIDDIKTGISDNDAGKIAAAAHPLKSSSMQVGAIKLGELAKDIELSAKAGNLEDTQAKFNQISDLYRQSEKLLREVFGI